MKISIRIQMFALILALGSLSTQAQQKLSGSYTMTIGPRIVSQETFTITVDASGAIEAQADVEPGPNKIHTVTKATKAGPQSFAFTHGAKLGRINGNLYWEHRQRPFRVGATSKMPRAYFEWRARRAGSGAQCNRTGLKR